MLHFVWWRFAARRMQEISASMSDLPVVMLVCDARGDVERAAEQLRGMGLRNPLVHLHSLGDIAAWRSGHRTDIAFLILHADACRRSGESEATPKLPAYPAFAVETVGGRLMASLWPSPDAGAAPRAPFDAPAVVRALHRLGLHWMVL
ncbi:hypothetical protein KK141_10505 [Dyella sp. LX-66]|uniref:hypothetical protein n=1 Tax=unclassified Dyella TaxID=2634549 RepID=UPI001BE02E64|nr:MULTISPECIES: hypothetical protein [unclassified Dyella]MBT2118676.1 hypothetical protein [Dyella sp. LX-1]MBT2139965.1 hypothetical protein [Dyella sp. LX-66]